MGCISYIIDTVALLILDFWLGLMQLIIPKKVQGNLRKVIKVLVYLFSFILFALMFVALVGMIFGDEFTRMVTKKMFFLCFGISVVQIGLGLIVRSISKKN